MEFAELASAIRIVELEATDRPTAIRELAAVTQMDNDGLSLERLLEAVEEREATGHSGGISCSFSRSSAGAAHRDRSPFERVRRDRRARS